MFSCSPDIYTIKAARLRYDSAQCLPEPRNSEQFDHWMIWIGEGVMLTGVFEDYRTTVQLEVH